MPLDRLPRVIGLAAWHIHEHRKAAQAANSCLEKIVQSQSIVE